MTSLLALAATVIGCHDAAPVATLPRATAPASRGLLEGELCEYVPAAGLRWMLMVRPRELLARTDVHSAVASLVAQERFDAFAAATGIDLLRTPAVLVAGFDYGTLYLAETAAANDLVERRFEQQLRYDAISVRPQPGLRRMTGVIGETPHSLVSIHGQLVAVAVGDITLARIVEAFARRKLRHSPSSLRGAALSTLPSGLHAAPFRFYAPGPFDAEWTAGAKGLLGSATALAVSAAPADPGLFQVDFVLAGDYGPDLRGTEQRLAESWREFVGSPTGRLLGMDQASGSPAVSAAPNDISLQVEVDLGVLASHVRTVISGDTWELLDLPPPPPPEDEPSKDPAGIE